MDEFKQRSEITETVGHGDVIDVVQIFVPETFGKHIYVEIADYAGIGDGVE